MKPLRFDTDGCYIKHPTNDQTQQHQNYNIILFDHVRSKHIKSPSPSHPYVELDYALPILKTMFRSSPDTLITPYIPYNGATINLTSVGGSSSQLIHHAKLFILSLSHLHIAYTLIFF